MTVSSALDWLSLLLQVYFPASLSSTLLIVSWLSRPSCFISYLYPGLRTTLPFLQSTGAPALESSQRKTPLSPSLTTTFSTSCLNVTGNAGGGGTAENGRFSRLSRGAHRARLVSLLISPLTLTSADVAAVPAEQLYWPPSVRAAPLMVISAARPSCLI